jgi:hypothetical protein
MLIERLKEDTQQILKTTQALLTGAWSSGAVREGQEKTL